MMGDRANIVVRDSWPADLGDREAVFLYSHWGGEELPQILHAALSKRERWGDGSYLARICVAAIVGDDHEGTTGVGISTRLGDNSYDLLVLLPGIERMVAVPEKHYDKHGLTNLDGLPSISFSEYIDRPRSWENLTDGASA